MKNIDRNTPYDWALLAAASAVSLPFIAANFTLVLFHKRRYFQAQGGVSLVVGSSIAGLAWICSNFLNNGHFTRPWFARNCILWVVWPQGLTVCLWFIFNLVRLHRIYLLSKGQDSWSWGYIFLIGLFLLPLVILSILLSKFQAFSGDSCHMNKLWAITTWLSVYALYLTMSLVILCMLRGGSDPLFAREHMHTSEYIALALVIVLASGSSFLNDASMSISGRCFITFGVCCLVFIHFWARFGWPVYLCLFRPKSDMDRLEQELHRSGARALRVVSSVHSGRAFQSSEGAVLEAVVKATQEVEDMKDKIKKLEQHKHILQERKQELELRRGLVTVTIPEMYP